MGLLNRMWAQSKAQAISSQTFDAMNHEMVGKVFGSGATKAGKMVTERTALGVAANWSCQRLISESLGMIPVSMFVKDAKGNAERAENHPLHEVLAVSPNVDQSDVEFRESVGINLSGTGNHYSLIGRTGSRITSLTPLASGQTRPMRNLPETRPKGITVQEGAVFFRVTDRGRTEDFPREKVWHLKLFGPDRLVGLSPIGAAREAMGGALAQEEFSNLFFSQGGLPAGTVSYPGWLTKEQREIARERLNDLLGGLGKAHQFAMFEGGVKPEPWNAMSMEDMQFIVGRRFSVIEICRFHRVPPHLVYDLEKASYASIEQMNLEYLTFSLMPYFKRIEASVSKWLLSPEDRVKFFLKFNPNVLLRTTTKERYEAHASALQNGWLSRNEVRGLEDKNNVPGLDEYTAQVNLVPVEDLGKLADAAAKPKQPSGGAPAGGDAGEKGNQTVNASIVLPETIRHEVGSTEVKAALEAMRSTSSMIARSIAAGNEELATELQIAHASLADAIGKAMKLISDRAGAERGEIASAMTALTDGMKELARIQKLPRRPVLDSNGDIVGSVVVET